MCNDDGFLVTICGRECNRKIHSGCDYVKQSHHINHHKYIHGTTKNKKKRKRKIYYVCVIPLHGEKALKEWLQFELFVYTINWLWRR